MNPDPKPYISPEEYQAVVKQVHSLLSEILSDIGPAYLNDLVNRATNLADQGGKIPGTLKFSGCGYKQERYRTALRKKTWVTHRTKFFREIHISSKTGPATESAWNSGFEFGITIDGDVARRTWREPCENSSFRFRYSSSSQMHLDVQHFVKSQWVAFEKSNHDLIKRDPRNYKSLVPINIGSIGGSNFPNNNYAFSQRAGVAQAYYFEDKYKKSEGESLSKFEKDSKLLSHYTQAAELLSIYIYTNGFVEFLKDKIGELDEQISSWDQNSENEKTPKQDDDAPVTTVRT